VTRDDLLAISREPNVAAFLRALRLGEGTKDDAGYRRIVGGGMADSLADHPRKMVWLPRYGVNSSAAGAYQFLGKTWDGLVRQYGFPSFEPQWQDAGAVGLIIGRKALDAVRKGDIRAAIALCRNEWASLPGSPYGQRTEAMDAVLLEYRKWGGTLTAGEPATPAPTMQDPAPIEHRDWPAEPPVPVGDVLNYGESKPMIPILPLITAVLPSIIGAIPELGKLFGSGSDVSQRNIAGATKVLEAVTAATGAVNAVEAAERIAADPAAADAARAAVQSIWFELVEAGGGGIDGARKADLARASSDWQWNRSASFMIALPLILILLLAVCSILFPVLGGDWPDDTRTAVVTLIVGSIIGSLTGYYFGSMTGKPGPR
jgi:muramidase (phage lysozyme)